MCFVLALAAGQPSGMLLGLFFLAWGAGVWYVKYGRGGPRSIQSGLNLSAPSPSAGPSKSSPSREQPNDALQLLREDKTYEHTARMVKAIPGLALYLLARAREEAANLDGAADWYSDCVLDLELTGAFHRTLAFCRDAALASLFVDALLFEAIGHRPTVPEDVDVMASLTHLYRGVGKYVIAKSTLTIGQPLDPIRVLEVRPEALQIREFAFSKTSSALVGNIVDWQAAYVKPTSFPGSEYLIRPGMQKPSKFKEQPEEYKVLVLASMKRAAQGALAPTDPYS